SIPRFKQSGKALLFVSGYASKTYLRLKLGFWSPRCLCLKIWAINLGWVNHLDWVRCGLMECYTWLTAWSAIPLCLRKMAMAGIRAYPFPPIYLLSDKPLRSGY